MELPRKDKSSNEIQEPNSPIAKEGNFTVYSNHQSPQCSIFRPEYLNTETQLQSKARRFEVGQRCHKYDGTTWASPPLPVSAKLQLYKAITSSDSHSHSSFDSLALSLRYRPIHTTYKSCIYFHPSKKIGKPSIEGNRKTKEIINHTIGETQTRRHNKFTDESRG